MSASEEAVLDVDDAATCTLCGSSRAGIQVAILPDRSGGGHATMCPRCQPLIKRARWSRCGRGEKSGVSVRHVHPDGGEKTVASGGLCDSCRERPPSPEVGAHGGASGHFVPFCPERPREAVYRRCYGSFNTRPPQHRLRNKLRAEADRPTGYALARCTRRDSVTASVPTRISVSTARASALPSSLSRAGRLPRRRRPVGHQKPMTQRQHTESAVQSVRERFRGGERR